MAIFGPKPSVNPFGKMSIFPTSLTSCFYTLEIGFFLLKYHKTHFRGTYCLKKKVGKMAIFEPKPWKNVNFSTFWTSGFYNLETRFFVLENHKRHLPGIYCLQKKLWKNGHSWTKTMSHPFGKMSIFRLFKILVFIASKEVFSL